MCDYIKTCFQNEKKDYNNDKANLKLFMVRYIPSLERVLLSRVKLLKMFANKISLSGNIKFLNVRNSISVFDVGFCPSNNCKNVSVCLDNEIFRIENPFHSIDPDEYESAYNTIIGYDNFKEPLSMEKKEDISTL